MAPTLQELAARVTALEAQICPSGQSTVNGWEAAARLLRKSSPTVKRLAKNDPRFPRPVRNTHFKRAGRSKPCLRPEWRRIDLINYNN